MGNSTWNSWYEWEKIVFCFFLSMRCYEIILKISYCVLWSYLIEIISQVTWNELCHANIIHIELQNDLNNNLLCIMKLSYRQSNIVWNLLIDNSWHMYWYHLKDYLYYVTKWFVIHREIILKIICNISRNYFIEMKYLIRVRPTSTSERKQMF